jgi:hypothetical protein
MNVKEIWSNSVGFFGKSANACAVAGFLLLSAVWFYQGFGTAVFAGALLLLAIHRASRELLIPLGLLGVTYRGFWHMLECLKQGSTLSPAKAAVIVAVILAWSALVALCWGRLLGKRDDD